LLISDQDEFYINIIQQILGGDSTIMDIVRELEIEKELTDEQIAARLGIRLNDIRRILYQLYETRLADCRRVRDEKTGWYVFFWHMVPDRINNAIIKKKKAVLNILKERLNYEESHIFFKCNNPNCARIPWEIATESGFRCPICNNDQLESVSNQDIIEFLKDQISNLEKSIK